MDSYVVVNKEDVLEAMGCFVASYLAQLPQAQNLQPAELQKAIKHAFKVGSRFHMVGHPSFYNSLASSCLEWLHETNSTRPLNLRINAVIPCSLGWMSESLTP